MFYDQSFFDRYLKAFDDFSSPMPGDRSDSPAPVIE